jgi:microcystin-dependent protein/hemin uptake protein HemP
VATYSPALTAHIAGLPLTFKATNANTGASTFNPGPGAIAIKRKDGTALQRGDIPAGGIITVQHDGTYYQLQSATPTLYYAADTGAANAYVATYSPALTAHIAGLPLTFKATNANTGASTFNPGPGAIAIKRKDGTALQRGDIPAGGLITVQHDGTYYQLQSATPTLYYAADTGSANAYVATYSPALTAHIAGLPLTFKATNANTGASTFNPGPGAIAIKRKDGTALQSGDIQAGGIITVHHDGTYYQLDTPLSTIPVGAEMFWPKETPPAGWLEENGAAISRTTYAALFAVISTMYGSGDGSTTFNLPDSRGMFLRVWDHGAAIDPDRASRTDRGDGTSGDHVGTEQAEALKAHTHAMPAKTATRDEMYGDGSAGDGLGGSSSKTTGSTGGNETRPVNTTRMMIIKY